MRCQGPRSVARKLDGLGVTIGSTGPHQKRFVFTERNSEIIHYATATSCAWQHQCVVLQEVDCVHISCAHRTHLHGLASACATPTSEASLPSGSRAATSAMPCSHVCWSKGHFWDGPKHVSLDMIERTSQYTSRDQEDRSRTSYLTMVITHTLELSTVTRSLQ